MEIKPHADLLRANLREANLREANLREANLREANLREANLREADLRKADLRKADLRWADLRWADLRWADLRRADLRRADLREADLRWADLRWADLRETAVVFVFIRTDGYQHVFFRDETAQAGCKTFDSLDSAQKYWVDHPRGATHNLNVQSLAAVSVARSIIHGSCALVASPQGEASTRDGRSTKPLLA